MAWAFVGWPGAELAALAQEGQKVFVAAMVAVDAGEVTVEEF